MYQFDVRTVRKSVAFHPDSYQVAHRVRDSSTRNIIGKRTISGRSPFEIMESNYIGYLIRQSLTPVFQRTKATARLELACIPFMYPSLHAVTVCPFKGHLRVVISSRLIVA